MKRLLTGFFPLLALALTSTVARGQEMHMIGVYQGRLLNERGHNRAANRHVDECDRNPRCDWGGGWDKIRRRYPREIAITVSKTGAPLTLILTSYEPGTWRITATPGVTIARIIVSGYYRQKVNLRRAGRGIPVTNLSLNMRRSEPFYFYEDDRDAGYAPSYDGDTPVCPVDDRLEPSTFQFALEKVAQLTGREPTSAQGGYDGVSFIVDQSTAGSSLGRPERLPGLCYRNADGTYSYLPE